MSAPVVWSITKKNSVNRVVRNGVAFNTQSLDGLNRAQTANGVTNSVQVFADVKGNKRKVLVGTSAGVKVVKSKAAIATIKADLKNYNPTAIRAAVNKYYRLKKTNASSKRRQVKIAKAVAAFKSA